MLDFVLRIDEQSYLTLMKFYATGILKNIRHITKITLFSPLWWFVDPARVQGCQVSALLPS